MIYGYAQVSTDGRRPSSRADHAPGPIGRKHHTARPEIGAGMLKDAMLRTLQAADIAGIRAFAVHAKDDSARKFYEHLEFFLSPTDPLHLFRLIKNIRQLLTK